MAYQALARKWRPRNFSEVVGQEHVVKALTHALEFDRMHHAYLFTGTRGVGKTTIARILAKALNCENRQGFDPCGQCLTCREVDEGRFVDLLEVDAASRTKVEDTRDLLENVQYAPTRARYKIYLIDEVHMLSGHSFNALLKTLEEPPPHVKFLLATTDPQKIPVTVLSRCLQFNLKRLHPEQIRGQMEAILQAEGIGYEQNAIRSLARAADGSMRDGLSLLDQAIVHGGGNLEDGPVSAMLGTVSRLPVFALLEAVAAGDASSLLEQTGQLAERAPNFADVLQQMLIVLHHTALAQWAPDAVRHDEDAERILALAQRINPEDAQLFYQVALIGQRDLPLAPEPRMGFDMVLLRMLAFRPAGADAPPVTPPAAKAPRPKVPAPSDPRSLRDHGVDSRSPLQSQTVAESRPSQSQTVAESRPFPPGEDRVRTEAPGVPECSTQARGAQATPPFPQQEGLDSASSLPPPPPSADGTWSRMIQSMGLAGMTLQLANNCVLAGIDDHSVTLNLDPQLSHIRTPQMEAKLEKALQALLGRPVRLQLSAVKAGEETPALQQQRLREERQRAAELDIEQDETVRALKERFDARIIPGSVKPID
ncbi:MAG: DNA polymerase III subunit gamma/tau [Methylococcaceae bacterium]|nr:DNA polymerase III subunit gamma/tau [Methylococcaceae bacterium]